MHFPKPNHGSSELVVANLWQLIEKQNTLRKHPVILAKSDWYDNFIDQAINIVRELTHEEQNKNNPLDGKKMMTDNTTVTAGFTYFGQFITHDITYEHLINKNYKPSLNLRSVYDDGKETELSCTKKKDSSQEKVENREMILKVRKISDGRFDFFREKNGDALVSDCRNDQHLIIAQMHLVWVRFHNALIDYLRDIKKIPLAELYKTAREIAVFHYRWLILNQYCKLLLCDPSVISDLLASTNNFKLFKAELMPQLMAEFTHAAMRIGHTQVQNSYVINNKHNASHTLFSGESGGLLGGRCLDQLEFDWEVFFWMKKEVRHMNFSSLIDLKVIKQMQILQLPGQASLDRLNLIRLDLEKSKDLSNFVNSVSKSNLKIYNAATFWESWQEKGGVRPMQSEEGLPLWLYFMFEAEKEGGIKLGPLGSQIIAEQIVWTIRQDPFLSGKDYSNESKDILEVFQDNWFKNYVGGLENGLPIRFSIQHVIHFPKYVAWLIDKHCKS